MDPVAEAILLSWNFELWVVIPLLAGAVVYLRGWLLLRKKLPHRFDVARLTAFQSGLIVVLLALASPIDVFAGLLLFVHMTQHILLTMVAAPLLLLGAPMLPLLRGLPRLVLTRGVAPILGIAAVRSVSAFLVRPPVALGSFSITTLVWHVPSLYELALRSEFWHQIEHICFFFTGLLFWWPIVQPWPSRRQWSGWAMILYLLVADLVNTALSAVLCFAERVLYPTYAAAPRLWGISALADQAAAGAIMWVAGSLAFLLPVAWILNRLLEPSLVIPPGKARPGQSPGPLRHGTLLALLLLILSPVVEPPPATPHHGGVLQFKAGSGPFVIAFFSESAPIYPELVELSVLVQNENGEPVLDAIVEIELRQANKQQPPIQAVATRSNSPNKLMYGNTINLPAPGAWEVTVRTRQGGLTMTSHGQLVVEAANGGDLTWLYLLPLGGVLVAVWLAWRKRHA